MGQRGKKPGDPLKRFWTKVESDSGGGCWIWNGTIGGVAGYGTFTVPIGTYRTRSAPAHRWIYEQIVGPIPQGLVLDHMCMVKTCVNPAHLSPVTRAENSRRARQVRSYEQA